MEEDLAMVLKRPGWLYADQMLLLSGSNRSRMEMVNRIRRMKRLSVS